MKANKFAIEQDDEAVSPVIAVILMVAITVVLAATVYVWVSGFGTSGSIKKFPQVTMKDGSGTPATSPDFDDNDVLVTLEHRGGDTINLADYTFNVFRAGTAVAAANDDEVDWGLNTETCSLSAPAGAFAVGNKLHICANNAATTWDSGQEFKLQIIDETTSSIVHEGTVVVT